MKILTTMLTKSPIPILMVTSWMLFSHYMQPISPILSDVLSPVVIFVVLFATAAIISLAKRKKGEKAGIRIAQEAFKQALPLALGAALLIASQYIPVSGPAASPLAGAGNVLGNIIGILIVTLLVVLLAKTPITRKINNTAKSTIMKKIAPLLIANFAAGSTIYFIINALTYPFEVKVLLAIATALTAMIIVTIINDYIIPTLTNSGEYEKKALLTPDNPASQPRQPTQPANPASQPATSQPLTN